MKTSEESMQIKTGLCHLIKAFNATDPSANIQAKYDNNLEIIEAVAYGTKKRTINVAMDSPLATMKDAAEGFYHLLY